MPVLETNEQKFLKRVKGVSMLDEKVITEVLKSILMVATAELKHGRKEVLIPYICKLEIDYHDEFVPNKGSTTRVELVATPLRGLIDEVSCISEGIETPTEKMVKRQFTKEFSAPLDVQENEGELF
jgi:hypothetical protein